MKGQSGWVEAGVREGRKAVVSAAAGVSRAKLFSVRRRLF